MLRCLLISAALMISALASNELCNQPPKSDGQCGPANGNAGCLTGYCCSEWGWCGMSEQHCNAHSLCQGTNPLPTTQPGTVAPTLPSGPAPISVRGVSSFNWCGPVPWVSLTFDDSAFSEPAITDLLNDLHRLNIKATFYICPNCYAHDPGTYCSNLRRILQDGHTIEDHSMNHPSFLTLPESSIEKEINDVPRFVGTQCGIDPHMTQFRPPFGDLNNTLALQINQLGYTIASWNIDSGDWRGLDLTGVFNTIVDEYRKLPQGSSAVIDLHDVNYTSAGTKGLLDLLIGFFTGFQFVTAEQCFTNCLATGQCESPVPSFPGVFA